MWIYHVCVRDRSDVDVGWRAGSEPGKYSAAPQGQRNALVALAKVIARSQEIVFADVLIDLSDKAIHVIAGAVRDLQVVAAGIGGAVCHRPGMPGKQICYDRIHHPTVVGSGGRNLCRRRNSGDGGDTYGFTLTFIRDKPEGSVLLDRSAERQTKLVVLKGVPVLIVRIEKVTRIKSAVAEVLIGRTVNRVAPGSSDDVDRSA